MLLLGFLHASRHSENNTYMDLSVRRKIYELDELTLLSSPVQWDDLQQQNKVRFEMVS